MIRFQILIFTRKFAEISSKSTNLSSNILRNQLERREIPHNRRTSLYNAEISRTSSSTEPEMFCKKLRTFENSRWTCGKYRHGKITYWYTGIRNTGVPARKISEDPSAQIWTVNGIVAERAKRPKAQKKPVVLSDGAQGSAVCHEEHYDLSSD